MTYLIGALQTVEATLGQRALAAFGAPGQINTESVLTTLLNEIAALSQGDCREGAQHPYVLVLDDYHTIESQALDQALIFILDHLPPQNGCGGMHLVIATRADPSLPLSRLRARGQLVELRVADLRFTPGEADAFFQAAHLPVSPDDVRTLGERTEGWITGLQLAALALQGMALQDLKSGDQVARFVREFGGSHRYVIDYLVDEVLDRQTPGVQAFLLQTSILDRMTAPLCDAVVGQKDSQAVLERLEAANLFLVPLDGERRWYRYHHLFADLLRRRLKRLYLALDTVKGHNYRIYGKLGGKNRTQAVSVARALRILPPP